MTAEDRLGAAYHEAGHAIALWVFGLQVDSVAIGIAGDDAAGHTEIMGSDEHLSEFDRIVISEAGLEAQEVFEAPTTTMRDWPITPRSSTFSAIFPRKKASKSEPLHANGRVK